MKRLIALLVVLGLLLGVAGIFTADAATVKKAVVKKKVVMKKKVVKKKVAPKKVAPKPVAPLPPPPPPVAPVPPPAPVVVKPAAPAGLFGMGINTMLSGQYLNTGKGQISGSIGAMGSWVMDDFVGLGSMIGLGANGIKYKLGLGGYYGGGGLKAIPVYAGGIIMLPADMMGGLETYLTGGLNYTVYGNGQTSGKIGGDVYVGFMADLGLGLGKTGFELGYSVVRSNVHTSKGLALSVSQPIVL